MLASEATVVLWDCDDAGLATARSALSGLGGVDARVVELTDEASVNAATAAAMSRTDGSTSSSTTPASPAATVRPGRSIRRSGGS